MPEFPDDQEPTEGGDPPVAREQSRLVKRRAILTDGEQRDHFDRQLVKRPGQPGY